MDPATAYAWISAAAMAGDARGRDLLHSLESVLNVEQIAKAREQASQLRQREAELSAKAFAQ